MNSMRNTGSKMRYMLVNLKPTDIFGVTPSRYWCEDEGSNILK